MHTNQVKQDQSQESGKEAQESGKEAQQSGQDAQQSGSKQSLGLTQHQESAQLSGLSTEAIVLIVVCSVIGVIFLNYVRC